MSETTTQGATVNIPRAQIWPTVTFNTCTPDGMAAAEAWTRELVDDPQDTPQAPSRPETPTDGTGIPPDRSAGTEGPFCRKCKQPIHLAEGAWNFSGHKDTGAQWWHSRCPDPMPPPKPGTHESDLSRVEGPFILPGEDLHAGRGGSDEWARAANWSVNNRTTERTT